MEFTSIIQPFGPMENHLKQYLEECLSRSVSLVLTKNSTSMLSARTQDGVLHVRLHRMFLSADRRVMSEIASYLKNRRGAMPHFRNFIRENREQLSLKPPKKVPVRTVGKFHDLCGLYDEINKEYFGGMVNAVITWGTRSPRYAVKRRTVHTREFRTREKLFKDYEKATAWEDGNFLRMTTECAMMLS